MDKRTDVVGGTRPAADAVVDIIIPIYKDVAKTMQCLASVIQSSGHTPREIIVINDRSPEEELTSALRDLARTGEVTLLENSRNLGFVQTVNSGFALHPERDVVILNSDTVVFGNWLDRLREVADLSGAGTVTPISNNATICSYPCFPHGTAMPVATAEVIDDVLRLHHGKPFLQVPTGVGFCMYIRRECLNAVGYFDEIFGAGYGEENDLCLRAQAAGWPSVLALNTFVWHYGGASFGGQAWAENTKAPLEIINRRYPAYHDMVRNFIKTDPLRRIRREIDLLRIARGGSLLFVSHNYGGGVQTHIDDLTHWAAPQPILLIATTNASEVIRLSLHEPGGEFEMFFNVRRRGRFASLVHFLKWAAPSRIHFHHTIGLPAIIEELPRLLKLPYDYTIHDYYTVCPQITLTDPQGRYCGEKGIAQCRACLKTRPTPGNSDITEWRDGHAILLRGARRVICPSRDVVNRMKTYCPDLSFVHAPHPEPHAFKRPNIRAACTGELRILVLGAISREKGADVIEGVATLAASLQPNIVFHLVGYAYRGLKSAPSTNLFVHGRYKTEDLPEIIHELDPHIAWLPATWAETYSYALSEILRFGLPVATSNLGAFVERLQGRGLSWILPWESTPARWLEFFTEFRDRLLCGEPVPSGFWEEKGKVIPWRLPLAYPPPGDFYPARYLAMQTRYPSLEYPEHEHHTVGRDLVDSVWALVETHRAFPKKRPWWRPRVNLVRNLRKRLDYRKNHWNQ